MIKAHLQRLCSARFLAASASGQRALAETPRRIVSLQPAQRPSSCWRWPIRRRSSACRPMPPIWRCRSSPTRARAFPRPRTGAPESVVSRRARSSLSRGRATGRRRAMLAAMGMPGQNPSALYGDIDAAITEAREVGDWSAIPIAARRWRHALARAAKGLRRLRDATHRACHRARLVPRVRALCRGDARRAGRKPPPGAPSRLWRLRLARAVFW